MLGDDKENAYYQSNLDYLYDCELETLRSTPRLSIITVIICAVIIFGFLVWSAFFTINLRTVVPGKVVVASHVKMIQNLDWGRLDSIKVGVGDEVVKGQLLMVLDKTQYQAVYSSSKQTAYTLFAKIARLKAERGDDSSVAFSQEIINKVPKLVAYEKELFNARKNILNETLGNLQLQYDTTNKELKMIKPLVAQGVIAQIELNQLELKLADIKSKMQQAKFAYHSRAVDQLNKATHDLLLQKQSLKASGDRLSRTELRSPIDGVVNKINIHTIGEVISPGETLMEVVPSNDDLIIKAKVSPDKIGFIHVGQRALVKVDAYDYTIYGGLEGKVVSVGHDTVTNDRMETFYTVKIQAESDNLQRYDEQFAVLPGMTASVNIATKRIPLLTYIMKPLIKTFQSGIGQR